MTPRARRLATGVALLVVVLFIGRWSADLLTEHWWAASISPAAESVVVRWRLLGFALDLIAIATAAAWFALQAVLVARAIASVQVARQVGNLRLREAVPTRLLLLGAVATGILLGLVTGAGAREWRAPLALAWQGVTYGVRDPWLHEDAGVFVSQLPLWGVAHGFATLLVVLGLCFVGMLYAGIGAIRREDSALVVHPYARRHLGLLLVAVAAVIAVGYLLAPYQFVSGAPPVMSQAGALTRIRSSQVMAGVALGVAVLSLMWIRRGRHALLAGGWLVLAIGALVERVIVPALTAEASAPAGSDAVLARFDALAWGIREGGGAVTADTIPAAPAVWDKSLLGRYVEGNGGTLLASTQSALTLGNTVTPAWYLATSVPGDSARMDVLAIVDGPESPGGPPVSLHPAGAPASRPVWSSLGDARLIPGSADWRAVSSGIRAGGPLRRLLLAWARQAGGLLVTPSETNIDWHLDPSERAKALLPMIFWSPADIAIVAGRPIWVVQGLVPLERFPLAAEASWRGETIGGLVAGFVAMMDPVSGTTRIFLDPGADSTAAAWARFAHGLVEPASAMPVELRQSLTYPAEWLETQLQVLESEEWNLGKRPGRISATGPPGRAVPIWRSPSQPARQAAFEDADRRTLAALVTASRSDGLPTILIERYEGNRTSIENGRELERLWGRTLPLMHIRDSARAAGDTVAAGRVHWFIGNGVLAAWQPMFSVPSRGTPSLLWVSTSLGASLGGGRSIAEAWRSLRSDGTAGALAAPGTDAVILGKARLWMQRADSALARGDLTAFGRAIEELRALLKP